MHHLVPSAQAGDSAALVQLLEEFDNVIQAACRQYYVPAPERGDLLQEAYLGFLHAVNTYDPQRGGPFPGYAKAKTRERVWSYIRARNRTKSRELLDGPGGGEEEGGTLLDQLSDPHAEEPFCEEEWRSLLASLSEREVLAVEKIAIDGMSMAELARREGVSADTVKTWKQRAFAKIRAALHK
jgi:RNA polymerase sigma factor (sigma-70 family)